MMKKKIQLKNFCKPKSKLTNYFKLSKISFEHIELSPDSPCIFASPKVSELDELLITKCIKSPFVFFNEETVELINNGNLSKNREQEILDEINSLVSLGFSFSLIWNNSPTIFGTNEPMTESMMDFLIKTKLDVKFLTFPNEYFVKPVWCKEIRKATIYANQKLKVTTKMLRSLSEKEQKNLFISSTPSKPSSYLKTHPILLKSNNLAVGLEQIFYCCPNCKKLLSLYSEYSCIKCKNCGSAFELAQDGTILFSKELKHIEDIESFQINTLSKKDFTINEIISYDNLTQISTENCKKPLKIGVILHIYAEKLIVEYKQIKKKITIYYEDVENVDYMYNNNIVLQIKNAKQFHFFGKSNENLLIIKDLVKLNKN